MFTQQLAVGWSGITQNPITLGPSFSADGSDGIDQAVAALASNQLVQLTLDLSQLKFLLIVATKDMTLKTNSSGSPQETKTLTANVPILWYTGCGYTIGSLFAGDVTKFYVSNPGSVAGILRIRSLFDSTP